MKIRFTAGILGIIFLFALSALAVGRPVNSGVERERDVPGKWARKNFVPGEVLVKFRAGTDEWDRDQARRGIRAGKHRRLGRIGVEKVKLPPGMSVEEAVKALEDDPRVEYAEPNRRVVYLGMPTSTPNDPAFANSQWYLDRTPYASPSEGFGPFSIDVDIDAPEAWGVMDSTFDTTMTAGVGVIDSGDGSAGFFSNSVGYIPNHEDLLNSLLFVNTGEVLGTTFDNDSNGYIDDVNGWDFIGSDNAPADSDTSALYHGTKISGIIAAAWGNGTGIAGIGRAALRVLPLRGESATVSQYIEAIGYASSLAGTGENVRVLNASWAIIPQGVDSKLLREEVQKAGAAPSGLIFVAAAGNNSAQLTTLNNDRLPVYPASYSKTLSNVLSVAASDTTGDLAYFSHFGPASVQIAAPGQAIYATSGGFNGYAYVSGTSFAAPIAASALGLIMAADPSMTPDAAINRLLEGGDFDARLAGVVESGKRVNLAGALAPFHPWSGLAPLGATQPVAMYADSIGAQYATFTAWTSSDPTVAVLTGNAGSGWAVSPVSPGIATFTLSFPAGSSWETGPWRVTGIAPFTAGPAVGDTVAFTSLVAIAGTPSWSVADTSVGSINPTTGVFTALAEGRTRVSLSIGGSLTDTSGYVTVMNPPSSGGGGGGGGCFIATAAFGSYEAPAVKLLRDFRDADLLTNGPGRRFVAAYYRYSPPAAQWLDDHPRLKPAVRVLLLPLVGFAWVSVKFGLMWAALLLALLLLSMGFPAWKYGLSWK